MDWYQEKLYPDIGLNLKITRVIHRVKTELQDLVIFENSRMGRVLALDGVVQTTEGDEYIYHEMMAHVPIFAHGNVRSVLIIGGGDGGLLEEVLKHKTVERVVMVEIDPFVIDLCKRYLPSIPKQAFEDRRAEVLIADGAKYVAETAHRFDVVMIDSTDPSGPSEVLFQSEFYANCKRCLKPGGVMVNQNGVPFFQADELTTTWRRLSAIYPDAAFYLMPVPSYFGGFMALGWASLDAKLRQVPHAELARRVAGANIEMHYYNADIHLGSFALPSYIRALMN